MAKTSKMKVGICADHGGFALKEKISPFLIKKNFNLVDFGAHELNDQDDYPDYVIPLAKAVSLKEVDRGIAICGSGVGACIAANKVVGARGALIHDYFSARQGVEDDNMNIICLGGGVIGFESAKELILAFLNAKFSEAERHLRRLEKIKDLENGRETVA